MSTQAPTPEPSELPVGSSSTSFSTDAEHELHESAPEESTFPLPEVPHSSNNSSNNSAPILPSSSAGRRRVLAAPLSGLMGAVLASVAALLPYFTSGSQTLSWFNAPNFGGTIGAYILTQVAVVAAVIAAICGAFGFSLISSVAQIAAGLILLGNVVVNFDPATFSPHANRDIGFWLLLSAVIILLITGIVTLLIWYKERKKNSTGVPPHFQGVGHFGQPFQYNDAAQATWIPQENSVPQHGFAQAFQAEGASDSAPHYGQGIQTAPQGYYPQGNQHFQAQQPQYQQPYPYPQGMSLPQHQGYRQAYGQPQASPRGGYPSYGQTPQYNPAQPAAGQTPAYGYPGQTPPQNQAPASFIPQPGFAAQPGQQAATYQPNMHSDQQMIGQQFTPAEHSATGHAQGSPISQAPQSATSDPRSASQNPQSATSDPHSPYSADFSPRTEEHEQDQS